MNSAAVRGSTGSRAAIALAFVALSIAGCAALELKERELVFRPTREAAGWYSGMPDSLQELYLSVGAPDAGERIHAWWWPADQPGAPVVLYLHGVHWNLTGQLNRMSQLRRFGFSVFAIDYRGFGKSDGDMPSEASVYEDARAGWQWLTAHEPDASRRYIYGHSLGGAVAIDLAAHLAADAAGAHGLIVEASFTSLSELVSEMGYGWLPARLLLTQKFDSLEKIGQVRMPVLIVHGADDRYVPPRLSEALFAAAPPPKKLLLIPNGTHNNSAWTGDADYRLALRELFGPIGPAPTGTEEPVAILLPAGGRAPVNRGPDQAVLESTGAEK
jgi:hypothetical protein